MGIRVLLVDDEPDFIETLCERLQLRNFTVLTALNGDEAIRKAELYELDVIVMDVLMPGKSGIETYQEIKKIHPSLKVIMLTGHAQLNTAMSGLKMGIDDYLIKPIKIEELVEKIELAYGHKILSEEKKGKNE